MSFIKLLFRCIKYDWIYWIWTIIWQTTHTVAHILFQFPAAFIRKSMPPSLLTFRVSASPCFLFLLSFFFLSQNPLYINTCCHVRPTSTGRCGCHTRVRDGGRCGGRWEIWVQTESVSGLSLREGTLSLSVWGWDHRIRMCLTLLVIV